jgi:hypothetical protein
VASFVFIVFDLLQLWLSMCHVRISNLKLVNIDYTKLPKNVTSVDCSYNELIDINFDEYKDIYSINCRQNKLKSIESMNNLDELDCSFNNISSIEITNIVNDLNCSHNRLYKLSNIIELNTFENLITLNCDSNSIEEIECLPINLKYFSCASNKITYLNNLPINLIELNCSNNLITFIGDIPSTVEKLYINNNKLYKINISLNSNIRILNISHNFIIETNILSKKFLPKLVELYCTDTLITNMPMRISSYLEIIDIRNNRYLSNIPDKMCYYLYNLLELNIMNTGISELQLKYIKNATVIQHGTIYKIDNIDLVWFHDRHITLTYKFYTIIRKMQRKLKKRFQVKLRAILIIQRGCHNWIWKPVCKDGTIGIRLRLDCLYLDRYINK